MNKVKIFFLTRILKMMIACDKASFLMTKKIDGKLSPSEKINLEMHKLGCSLCRIYEKDIIVLNDYLRNKDTVKHPLNQERKDSIHKAVLEEMKK